VAAALGGTLLVLGGFLLGRRFPRALGVPAPFSAAAPSPTPLLADLSLVKGPSGVSVSDPSRLSRAPVLSVVDGDTLHVLWDGQETRLRYYGVDTPEVGQACHDEAQARNAALAGKEVLLAFDERPRDNYGRLLAYVFTADGTSVDAALVAEGFGRAWTRDGRWRDGIKELERAARADKTGCLWSRPAADRSAGERLPKARKKRGAKRKPAARAS
jgi:micrococcal nuclease